MPSWNVAAIVNANAGLDARADMALALNRPMPNIAVEIDVVGTACPLSAIVRGEAIPLDGYLMDPRLDGAPLLFDLHDPGSYGQLASWLAEHPKHQRVLGAVVSDIKMLEVHADPATSVNGQFGRYTGTRLDIRGLIAEYGVWPVSLSYSLSTRFRRRNRWRFDCVYWTEVELSEFANSLRSGDDVLCCVETKSPLGTERRDEILRRALRPIVRRPELDVNLVPQGGVEQCVAFHKVLNDLKAEAR